MAPQEQRTAKQVLVTGGSRGLGLALVRDLSKAGWHVYTVSRQLSDELKNTIESSGNRIIWWQADLGDPEQVKRIGEREEILSGLDAFIANAAIGTDGLLTLLGEHEIRRTVEVNLTSTILLTRQVVKGMLQRGRGGVLVFIASVAAITGFRGLSVYAATKAGLLGFSRTLAREYGERGIRSNAILPGFLETEMSAGLSAELRARLLRRIPAGRFGTVNDVVGLVRFLLSEEASYLNGGEFVIDGGMRA